MTDSKYTAEEIKAAERAMGHAVPRPYSDAMAEDLYMEANADMRTKWYAMAKQVYVTS